MVLKPSIRRVAALTWVLIFGGMLALALGLVLRRSEPGLGGVIALASIACIVVGVVLVWVRSRMEKADPP